MRVADRVAEFLEVWVWPGVEMFVEFGLVLPVGDAEGDDLPCCLCVGEVEGGRGVELDVLGWDVDARVEHLAWDVEDLHGEAAGLGDAVLVVVSGLWVNWEWW